MKYFQALFVALLFSCGQKEAPADDQRVMLKQLGFECSEIAPGLNSCDTSCFSLTYLSLTDDAVRHLLAQEKQCMGSGLPGAWIFELSPKQKKVQHFESVISVHACDEMLNGYQVIELETPLYYSYSERTNMRLQYAWQGEEYRLLKVLAIEGRKIVLDEDLLLALDVSISGWNGTQFARKVTPHEDSIYIQYLDPPTYFSSDGQEQLVLLTSSDSVNYRRDSWILKKQDNKYTLIQSFRDQFLSPVSGSVDALSINFVSAVDSMNNAGAYYIRQGNGYVLSKPSSNVRYYGDDYNAP